MRARSAANSTLARFTDAQRQLDAKAGIPLARPATATPAASCSSRPRCSTSTAAGLPQGKADNQILGVVQRLREQQPGARRGAGVRDINMRVKARALGLPAEDYFNDKTLEDGDLLYTGVLPLPATSGSATARPWRSWQQGGHTFYRISGPLVPALLINQFVYLEAAGRRAAVRPRHRDHRQDRGAEDAARLHPRQERGLGRDRRATASRTSRSTC